MLGLVPSLVSAWRSTGCLNGLDWSRIRAFSSSGECSNPQDMLFLMSRAGYKPVIEYCGGTEIGGAYITGTVVLPAAPSIFSTPALGSDLVILNEAGQARRFRRSFPGPALHGVEPGDAQPRSPRGVLRQHSERTAGSVARRHGDLIERLPGGYFRAHGRADDCMNLGGIKVSSLADRGDCRGVEGVREAAAVAVSPPMEGRAGWWFTPCRPERRS